jgi:hypothetical protein
VRDRLWRPFVRHGRTIEEIGLTPDHEGLDDVARVPDAVASHQAATNSG